MKKRFRWDFVGQIVLLAVLAVVLIFPRTQQLGRYVFVDETYYLKNSARFYWAIANHEYGQTDLVIHPGVTTHWLGAAAFWAIFPEYAEKQGESGIADLTFRRMLENNDLSLIYMLIWARFAVVVFNVVLLILAYLLLKQLFNPWLAVLGTLLVGFDPFYFDFSRFLHVDGMVAGVMFVSVLAFLVYLKERKWGWLLLSGAMAGLSVLTKVPGILLLGVVGLLSLIDWAWREDNAFGVKRSWRGLGALAGRILLWSAVLVLAIFLLWPAMWVDPLSSFSRITAFVFEQGSAEIISPMFFNGEMNPNGVFGWEYAYYYPLSYLWRASPVTLGGLVLLVGAYFFRKRVPEDALPWDTAGKLLVYILFFTVLMTVSVKKFDRYLLPAFLPLDLLAAAGFYFWIKWMAAKIPDRFHSAFRTAALVLAVLAVAGLQGWQVSSVFPYGLSYYDPLMGGGEKAPEVMMVGYGEGLDQAATYMMTVPNKRNLKIYSFYSGVFGFHFYRQVNDLPWYPGGFSDKVFNADYWIIYSSERQRGMSAPALEYVAGYEPEHTVVINGIEYAWIYNLNKIRGE